ETRHRGRGEHKQIDDAITNERRADDRPGELVEIIPKPDQINRKRQGENDLKEYHVGERQNLDEPEPRLPGIESATKFSDPNRDQAAIPAEPLRDERRNRLGNVGEAARIGSEPNPPAGSSQLQRKISILADLHVL